MLLMLCIATSRTAYCLLGDADPISPGISVVAAPVPHLATKPFSHTAFGFTVGSLGAGVETVTTMSRRANLRLNGQFLGFSDNLKQDGVGYNARLRMANARISYDFYPFPGGLRVSTGMAVYNQLNARAAALIPGGQMITFNDANYYSSAKDPLHGTGRISLSRRTAPTLTMGWGNAIPRKGRRFAFPFEVGVAFVGTPQFDLNLTGSACSTPDPMTCASVTGYAQFKSNVAIERDKINRDIRPLRFFPIVNLGATYRF